MSEISIPGYAIVIPPTENSYGTGDVVLTNVTGTLTNGNTLTITGTGFGSKTTAAPLISSYDNATSTNNFSAGSIGGDWGTRGDTVIGNASQYLKTPFYQNSYYSECPYIPVDYSQLQYDGQVSDGAYFYTSMWFYVTASQFCPSTSSTNSKFWRWYVNPTGGDGGTVSENWAGSVQGSCPVGSYAADGNNTGIDGGQGDRIDYLSPIHPIQEWVHHEAWVFAGSINGTDGRYIEKINGRNVRDWGGWGIINSARPHTINYFRFGQVSGYNNAGGSILLTDMYIDNTQAHVFLSSASTYNDTWTSDTATSTDEVQIASSWASTSVNITMNQANWTTGQTAYVYVVNSNGSVNNQGYPVVIS